MATTIPMSWCLILAAALFFLGMGALLVRRNALTVFMGIELMLNSANLTFLTFARERGDQVGHLSAFFVISVAAAEAAVGLAVIIGMFRSRGTINVDEVHSMRH